MTQGEIVVVVAARLAAYLPPGAAEAECTIPIGEIDTWLAAAEVGSLPLDARDLGWWADLQERCDYPGLPGAGWQVERIDWEGAGVTFSWDDGGRHSARA